MFSRDPKSRMNDSACPCCRFSPQSLSRYFALGSSQVARLELGRRVWARSRRAVSASAAKRAVVRRTRLVARSLACHSASPCSSSPSVGCWGCSAVRVPSSSWPCVAWWGCSAEEQTVFSGCAGTCCCAQGWLGCASAAVVAEAAVPRAFGAVLLRTQTPRHSAAVVAEAAVPRVLGAALQTHSVAAVAQAGMSRALPAEPWPTQEPGQEALQLQSAAAWTARPSPLHPASPPNRSEPMVPGCQGLLAATLPTACELLALEIRAGCWQAVEPPGAPFQETQSFASWTTVASPSRQARLPTPGPPTLKQGFRV